MEFVPGSLLELVDTILAAVAFIFAIYVFIRQSRRKKLSY